MAARHIAHPVERVVKEVFPIDEVLLLAEVAKNERTKWKPRNLAWLDLASVERVRGCTDAVGQFLARKFAVGIGSIRCIPHGRTPARMHARHATHASRMGSTQR